MAQAQSRFDVERYVVQGNTLLPDEEVRRLVSPFEGKSRDFGDVQRALEALQDAYNERGYTAVRVLVPEQDLVAGSVRIEVTEARISTIKIEGNRFFDDPNVRAGLPSLREGTSPNAVALSENIQLVNENPAKQVNVALEPGQASNEVNAVVRVNDDDPTRWSLSLDNTGTGQTGYFRTGVGYQNANVFNRDQVLNLQYITSPDHIGDVAIFGAGYRVPIYGWKGALDVFGGHSDVNSGTVQNLFTVAGSGTIFGLRYTQQLPKLDLYEQKVSVGWDYRAFRTNVALVGTTASLLPDVTVKPLSVAYNGRLSRVGQDLAGFVSYASNLSGGGDASQTAITAQRLGANAHYAVVRYGAAFSQALPEDYLMRAQLSGQYTRAPLISGEQFGMGGADSVRGYFEREVASDVGHRLSLEGYSPDFGARLADGWRSRGLVFLDAARGNDRTPVRIATNDINGLASVGVGLRASQGRRVSARIDYARVLNAAGTRPVGKDRLHFALMYSF